MKYTARHLCTFMCLGFVAASASKEMLDTVPYVLPHCDIDNILDCSRDIPDHETAVAPLDKDPFGNEFLSWLRGGQDTASLAKKLKQVISTNKVGTIKTLFKIPTKKAGNHKIKIKSLHDFEDKAFVKLMKKKHNTFVTHDKLTIVFYDKKNKAWVLQVYDPGLVPKSLSRGEKIALSKCINSKSGNSGAVSAIFRGSFDVGTNTQTPTDLLNPANNNVLLSLAGKVQIGSTAKVSGSITCLFDKGHYAQPYMYPFFIQIPEGRRVNISYKKNKGIMITGVWAKTQPYSKLALVSPLLECEIGNSSEVCDTGAGSGVHITQLKDFLFDRTKDDTAHHSR